LDIAQLFSANSNLCPRRELNLRPTA